MNPALNLPGIILALVVAQRLGELFHSRRNEARLRAMGGVEAGAGHYPFFFLVHGGWLAALAFWVARGPAINWWWLGLFALLQIARIWVLGSLGPYWCTRIITVPAAPLISSGPYRWLRHPNYLLVIGEIAVLPLAFSAYAIAITFSILNALLLVHRIRVENAALQDRR
ncbi:MAG: isoprenylcysteine carboxylmethyltransferase family protein [Proteobacteria bacterium]|nr:isoprenylcysteine carboxylmethyltransferase family protein [Pseudomonadota bacterium]